MDYKFGLIIGVMLILVFSIIAGTVIAKPTGGSATIKPNPVGVIADSVIANASGGGSGGDGTKYPTCTVLTPNEHVVQYDDEKTKYDFWSNCNPHKTELITGGAYMYSKLPAICIPNPSGDGSMWGLTDPDPNHAFDCPKGQLCKDNTGPEGGGIGPAICFGIVCRVEYEKPSKTHQTVLRDATDLNTILGLSNRFGGCASVKPKTIPTLVREYACGTNKDGFTDIVVRNTACSKPTPYCTSHFVGGDLMGFCTHKCFGNADCRDLPGLPTCAPSQGGIWVCS